MDWRAGRVRWSRSCELRRASAGLVKLSELLALFSQLRRRHEALFARDVWCAARWLPLSVVERALRWMVA